MYENVFIQYSNYLFSQMSALKVQMQSDSAIIDRLEQEKAQAFGIVGDLKATITGLEGQVRKNKKMPAVQQIGVSLGGEAVIKILCFTIVSQFQISVNNFMSNC